MINEVMNNIGSYISDYLSRGCDITIDADDLIDVCGSDKDNESEYKLINYGSDSLVLRKNDECGKPSHLVIIPYNTIDKVYIYYEDESTINGSILGDISKIMDGIDNEVEFNK